MATVGDKFWLFACEAGGDNEGWGLPAPSRMTPAEGCFYLGLDNLIMIQWEGQPAPPFHQYAIPFRPLDRVVWSVVGSGGQTTETERGHVIDLAGSMPNITGVMMDDFFNGLPERGHAALKEDSLVELKREFVVDGRALDLWVVIYTHQLDLPVANYLDTCDYVSLWTWHSRDLIDLDDNLRKLEGLAPSCRKVLGIYLWDYGEKLPISVDQMRFQCEKGLDWLTSGRIDGMIFLANTVADLDLDAVEWTRDWIAEVKSTTLDRRSFTGGRADTGTRSELQ